MNNNDLGYEGTPKIPDSDYRVHDPDRPQPPVVHPGKASKKGSIRPPSDAVILFDGTSLEKWKDRNGDPAKWNVEENYMEVSPGKGDILTREKFGDCQLHLEWASPTEINGDGQGRGNSGVFMMDRYEIQVLDCYDNPTYADGMAGAVYGQKPPLVNACRKPGEWQTYDIIWIAPRFSKGELKSLARLTLLHNNIIVQHNTKVLGPTTHKDVLDYEPHPAKEPLRLQDHGDRIRFRNLWYRPLNNSND